MTKNSSTSEQAAQKWLTSNGCNLPDEAFIMMGDAVKDALDPKSRTA